MNAGEIMTRDVVTVPPTATTSEIAMILAESASSNVPVCEADGTLLGIVGEADLTRYLANARGLWRGWWSRYLTLGSNRAPAHLNHTRSARDSARELMRTDLITAAEATCVADVVEMMLDHDFRRVPVVRDGKLVGVVTRQDVVKTMAPNPATGPPA